MAVTAARLGFRLLGELEVDGVPSRMLGGPKQRALLAYLLLHANELVPRDRLIDAVWGEHVPPTARSIVHGYVRKLRAALEDTSARIVSRSQGYVLEVEPEELDVRQFERLANEGRDELVAGDPESAQELLAEALALWRGEPLADLIYERSAEAESRRLADLRLEATMDRIDAELALGTDGSLVGELESLVSLHPFAERLRGQLMLALYRAGRQADALDAFRAAKAALAGELGIDPGPNLQQLEEAILRQEPALSGRVRTPTQPPRPRLHRAVAVTVLVAAIAGIAALVVSRLDGGAPLVAPNSVGVIDPNTNKLIGQIRVGTRPGPVAVGDGSVWVANLDDGTIARIDPRTRKVQRYITLNGGFPSDIAVGNGAVWVADGTRDSVIRVSPLLDAAAKTIPAGCGTRGAALPASISAGSGGVWFVCGVTLARIEPATNHAKRADYLGLRPTGIAARLGALWVTNGGENSVSRVDPQTMRITDRVTVGSAPQAIAVEGGAVWVAASRDDAVSRVAGQPLGSGSIAVGKAPVDVAAGKGAIWVANSEDGTVARIDPRTRKIVATIRVGDRPAGIAVGDGSVWVTVQAREKGGLR